MFVLQRIESNNCTPKYFCFCKRFLTIGNYFEGRVNSLANCAFVFMIKKDKYSQVMNIFRFLLLSTMAVGCQILLALFMATMAPFY